MELFVQSCRPLTVLTPIEDALEKVGSKCVHGTFGRTVPVITHMCASVCGHTGDVGSNHIFSRKYFVTP